MATVTDNKVKIGNYMDIIEQIGGNKFLAMTGSKILHYGYDKNGYVYLTFKLTKNNLKAGYLKIQLNYLDLYNMEFTKIKKTLNSEYAKIGIKIYDEEIIPVETIENVYGDQLEELFQRVTGLYTRL